MILPKSLESFNPIVHYDSGRYKSKFRSSPNPKQIHLQSPLYPFLTYNILAVNAWIFAVRRKKKQQPFRFAANFPNGFFFWNQLLIQGNLIYHQFESKKSIDFKNHVKSKLLSTTINMNENKITLKICWNWVDGAFDCVFKSKFSCYLKKKKNTEMTN